MMKNGTIRILFASALILLLFAVVLPFALVWRHMHPVSLDGAHPAPGTYAAFEGTFEILDLIAEDGTPLKAWLLHGDTGAPAIIMVHGLGGTKAGLLNLGVRLNKEGWHVLLLDTRGHGENGRTKVTFGLDETMDIRVAGHYLESRPDVDAFRFGVYAQSMGSAGAIRAMAPTGRVRAFVIDSGFDSLDKVFEDQAEFVFGLPRIMGKAAAIPYLLFTGSWPSEVDAAKEAARTSARFLFFHADSDFTIPIERGLALYEKAGGKKLFLTSHGDHLASWGKAPEEYERLVVDFFRGSFADTDFDPKTFTDSSGVFTKR